MSDCKHLTFTISLHPARACCVLYSLIAAVDCVVSFFCLLLLCWAVIWSHSCRSALALRNSTQHITHTTYSNRARILQLFATATDHQHTEQALHYHHLIFVLGVCDVCVFSPRCCFCGHSHSLTVNPIGLYSQIINMYIIGRSLFLYVFCANFVPVILIAVV